MRRAARSRLHGLGTHLLVALVALSWDHGIRAAGSRPGSEAEAVEGGGLTVVPATPGAATQLSNCTIDAGGVLTACCGNATAFSLMGLGITAVRDSAFAATPGVTELSLAHNALAAVGAGALRPLHRLTGLYLDHNNLTAADLGAFAHLPALEKLGLGYNRIREVSPVGRAGGAPGLPALRHLLLDHNALEWVAPGAFEGLPPLESLRLDFNELSNITGAAIGAAGPALLNLTGNRLARIGPPFLAGVRGTQTVLLAHNGMRAFNGTAHFDNISFSVPLLPDGATRLDLSHNELAELPAESLGDIIWLDVSHNRLTSLDPGLHAVPLYSLDVSHNRLRELAGSVFERAASPLAHLFVNDNLLDAVPSAVCSGGGAGAATRLAELRLHGNPIRALPADTFRNCTALNGLSLNNMSLTSVDGLFAGGWAARLAWLDLSLNTGLTRLDLNAPVDTPELQELVVSDCGLRALPLWEQPVGLSVLDAGNNPGMAVDARTLQAMNASLAELYLYGCGFGAGGLPPLALAGMENLRGLDLSYNDLPHRVEVRQAGHALDHAAAAAAAAVAGSAWVRGDCAGAAGDDACNSASAAPTAPVLVLPPSIAVLDISHNRMVGQLPVWPALAFLAANDNAFNSTLAPLRAAGPALHSLHAADNALAGDLDAVAWERLAQLRVLSLGGNQLQGTIPAALAAACVNLTDVDLSRNGLHGPVPRWSSPHVRSLVLYANTGAPGSSGSGLSGDIGDMLAHLPQLQVLLLADNALQGSLPASLDTLDTALQYVDISYNLLRGRLPRLDAEPLLEVRAVHNLLSGGIDAESFNWTALHNLSLGLNRLSGPLPAAPTTLPGGADGAPAGAEGAGNGGAPARASTAPPAQPASTALASHAGALDALSGNLFACPEPGPDSLWAHDVRFRHFHCVYGGFMAGSLGWALAAAAAAFVAAAASRWATLRGLGSAAAAGHGGVQAMAGGAVAASVGSGAVASTPGGRVPSAWSSYIVAYVRVSAVVAALTAGAAAVHAAMPSLVEHRGEWALSVAFVGDRLHTLTALVGLWALPVAALVVWYRCSPAVRDGSAGLEWPRSPRRRVLTGLGLAATMLACLVPNVVYVVLEQASGQGTTRALVFVVGVLKGLLNSWLLAVAQRPWSGEAKPRLWLQLTLVLQHVNSVVIPVATVLLLQPRCLLYATPFGAQAPTSVAYPVAVCSTWQTHCQGDRLHPCNASCACEAACLGDMRPVHTVATFDLPFRWDTACPSALVALYGPVFALSLLTQAAINAWRLAGAHPAVRRARRSAYAQGVAPVRASRKLESLVVGRRERRVRVYARVYNTLEMMVVWGPFDLRVAAAGALAMASHLASIYLMLPRRRRGGARRDGGGGDTAGLHHGGGAGHDAGGAGDEDDEGLLDDDDQAGEPVVSPVPRSAVALTVLSLSALSGLLAAGGDIAPPDAWAGGVAASAGVLVALMVLLCCGGAPRPWAASGGAAGERGGGAAGMGGQGDAAPPRGRTGDGAGSRAGFELSVALLDRGRPREGSA